MDGDGYDDFLVGAPSNGDAGSAAGAAYLVLGDPAPSSSSLGSVDVQYTGENSGDNAGSSIAIVGDGDGDGYDDVLVGARENSYGAAAAGAAFLVFGNPGPASISLSGADAEWNGETRGDYAGSSVSGAGDVDADGYDDFLVGASGSSDGAPGAGAAYLLLGGTGLASASLGSADASYDGESSYDEAGTSAAGAGDVNADGYDDVLVGAPGDDDGGSGAGAVYLVLGSADPASASLSAADAKYSGQDTGEAAGTSAAGIGDVNQDGYRDVLVGVPWNDEASTNSGAVIVFLGSAAPASASITSADAQYLGETSYDLAGTAVAPAGDVDADGHDDFMVGATGYDYGGSDAGAAYLILGTGW